MKALTPRTTTHTLLQNADGGNGSSSGSSSKEGKEADLKEGKDSIGNDEKGVGEGKQMDNEPVMNRKAIKEKSATAGRRD